jgi:hypothetical protein
MTQSRLVYNFTSRAFVRALIQYQDLERNQERYALRL